MGVPMKEALRWEQDYDYQIPETWDFPPAFREVVDCHFSTARSKDWYTRLQLYQDMRECLMRDSEKYGQYRWTASPDHKVDTAGKFDTFSLYRPEQAETEFSTSYRLRSVIEICRQRRSREFHGFIYLPNEVRNLIYSFALIKGKIAVPNSRSGTRELAPVKHYRSNNGSRYIRYEGIDRNAFELGNGRCAPTPLGLIQGVNRTIHDEAAQIFFGGNQFIFPAGEFHRPSYCNLLDAIIGSNAEDFMLDIKRRTNNAPLLRDVSYTFDMRDYRGSDHSNLYQSPSTKASVDLRTLSREDALLLLHDQKTFDVELDWAERIDCIKRMALDRLILAFEECYCPMGCCRKVEWVLDRFLHEGPPPGTDDTEDNAYSSLDWQSRPPLVVEVMGLVSDHEEVLAREKLGSLGESEIRVIPDLRTQDNFMDESGSE